MPIVFPPDLMVSVSGIRGRVGGAITPELIASLAAGFGAFLEETGREGSVFVGRDSRTSGPMLLRSAIAGLESVGSPVVELGMVPTPTLLLAVEEGRGRGGVAVTASHNPGEWNALKLASSEGTFLDAEAMSRFVDFVLSRDPARATWREIGSVRTDTGAVDRHLDRILTLSCLDVRSIKERGFRVALDCVNGAGGVIMPQLLEALGCEVVGIGTEPHGRFPRDPEPTAENLSELGRVVVESGAELGLGVDPDVDRLSLVDGKGIPLGEDFTLALAAAVVLRRTPGTVVTNLSTSQVVEDVAVALGGALVRAPVGEINVARRMQREGAVVGGEGNGGVILPELHLTRDGPVAAALVLQHLVEEGCSLRDAASRWPEYVIRKLKIAFPRESLQEAFEVLREDLGAPRVEASDGIRLSWPRERRWLHVRPSGTEPVVRIIAEGTTDMEVDALLRRVSALLEGVA